MQLRAGSRSILGPPTLLHFLHTTLPCFKLPLFFFSWVLLVRPFPSGGFNVITRWWRARERTSSTLVGSAGPGPGPTRPFFTLCPYLPRYRCKQPFSALRAQLTHFSHVISLPPPPRTVVQGRDIGLVAALHCRLDRPTRKRPIAHGPRPSPTSAQSVGHLVCPSQSHSKSTVRGLLPSCPSSLLAWPALAWPTADQPPPQDPRPNACAPLLSKTPEKTRRCRNVLDRQQCNIPAHNAYAQRLGHHGT